MRMLATSQSAAAIHAVRIGGDAARRPGIEAGKTVLRDRERVVLRADVSAVVEQRNPVGVEWSPIPGFAGEAHEVVDARRRTLARSVRDAHARTSPARAPARTVQPHARQVASAACLLR